MNSEKKIYCQIRFYKEDGKWYADVPERTKSENLMVCGADTFLEELLNHLKKITPDMDDSVCLEVTNDSTLAHDKPLYLAVFDRIYHNGSGARYGVVPTADGFDFIATPELWLCNVVHNIFGEHPRIIYLMHVDPCPKNVKGVSVHQV